MEARPYVAHARSLSARAGALPRVGNRLQASCTAPQRTSSRSLPLGSAIRLVKAPISSRRPLRSKKADVDENFYSWRAGWLARMHSTLVGSPHRDSRSALAIVSPRSSTNPPFPGGVRVRDVVRHSARRNSARRAGRPLRVLIAYGEYWFRGNAPPRRAAGNVCLWSRTSFDAGTGTWGLEVTLRVQVSRSDTSGNPNRNAISIQVSAYPSANIDGIETAARLS